MKISPVQNFVPKRISSRKVLGAVASVVILATAGGKIAAQARKEQLSMTGAYGQALVNMNNQTVAEQVVDLDTHQQNTAAAKAAYMASPAGSEEEPELQQAYVQSVVNWADAAINKTNATEEELDKVIDEVRYIQKYKAEGVQELITESKNKLTQLNAKMAVYDAPRKEAINQQLNGIFDETAANALANASKLRAGDREKSLGLCAKYVRLALQDSETIGYEEIVVESAKDLNTPYLESGVFTEINVPTKRDLENLPAGCLVVWQNGEGFGNAFAKHGHVFVTQGEGKATTDYNQWIKDYGTDFKVYVPTLKTTEEKKQDAIQARTDFTTGVTIGRAGQAKYLNRYIKWAEAVIKDGNASMEDVNDLVARLTEVPDNNKASDIQHVVQRTQDLLQQIKALYNIE